MKLAFSGKARYTDFDKGFELYKKRSRTQCSLTVKDYKKVVKLYCKALAERLEDEGMIDLPMKLGSVATVTLTRKPQFRGKKFIGYGKMNWETKQYDGNLKAFGIAFLPNRGRSNNLRSFGFVANRALFKNIKSKYESGETDWSPLDYKDEMI